MSLVDELPEGLRRRCRKRSLPADGKISRCDCGRVGFDRTLPGQESRRVCRQRHKILGFLLTEVVILSGCYRGPAPQTPAKASHALPAPLCQVDLGASLLAEVDNARLAIAQHDVISAANDVHQALLFARQLTDQPSNLFPSELAATYAGGPPGVSGTGIPHARLTAFGVNVKLTSAQAELDGNLDRADADLSDIDDGIPKQMIPSDLLLVRAAASLDLARSAASTGRTSDLRTQLMGAELALNTYAGPGHVVEAKALAAVIGQDVAQARGLNAILPIQISLWLGEVVEWAGSDRWSAQIP